MKIKYKCPRCEKETTCIVEQSTPVHKKLICDLCHKYIKFIGDKELEYCEKVDGLETKTDLQEVNFKLDLILDHLGIRAGVSIQQLGPEKQTG